MKSVGQAHDKQLQRSRGDQTVAADLRGGRGAMEHRLSIEDAAFRRAFEACEVAPPAFDHAAHVRLAYAYLCECSLTRAWIMAVDHFMQQSSSDSDSAASFISSNAQLLDSKIMLTHYSAEVLFSATARQTFVQPD